ncbi:hypothetical protein HanPI659440_Chr04g0178081 [Helianthus annuus]|nr:hypothetical protein HanPI659440_Chr04g0178081 [Helianthus annuus]
MSHVAIHLSCHIHTQSMEIELAGHQVLKYKGWSLDYETIGCGVVPSPSRVVAIVAHRPLRVVASHTAFCRHLGTKLGDWLL